MAFREILSACGVSPSLFSETGTAAREAWRQLLFGVIQPLGKLIESELSEKLEATINFDFSELRASDLQGRARAFQSLVGGGMAVEKAASLSGLLQPE